MAAKTQDVAARLAAAFERAEAERLQAPVLVVWDDPEGEFAEQVGELAPEGVECLLDEEGARFAVKRRLNTLVAGERALLYRQRAAHDITDDWFADAVLYAPHFQADLASAQLEELGCTDTPELRAVLGECRAFLAKRRNLAWVHALRPTFANANELRLAIMAAVLGRDMVPDWEQVVVRYLCRAREEGADGPAGELEAAGALDALGELLRDGLGYEGDVRDAEAICTHVVVSALSCELEPSAMAGLEAWVSAPHAQRCRALVLAWAGSNASDELREAATEVEEARNLRARLERVGWEGAMGVSCVPCAHEVVAKGLLRAFAEGEDVREAVGRAWDRRRTMPWFDSVSRYYEALRACAELDRLRREHADGFHAASPAKLWEAYTGGLWQVDAAYRAFRRAFEAALQRPNLELDDELKACAEQVENLYRSWFLDGLNARWFDLAADAFISQGYAAGVPRQRDFSLSEVEPAMARGERMVVIASDALRYEVACELAERLEAETKGRCELASAQAPFPSITATGMAALLPGSFRLEARDGRCRVLLDGQPCASTAERQERLLASVPGAVCVQADALMAMRRDEQRALVEGASLVYVFHNVVDAAGDDPKTEDDVFAACDEAVEDLLGLVDVVTRSLRFSNVVITADHGFLYAGSPLRELERVPAPAQAGALLVRSRRYALAAASMQVEGLLGVAMGANGAPGLVGLTPRGCQRIPRQGAGERYVHGGLSLQELCVPVLRFKNLRAGSKGYVEAEPVQVEPVVLGDVIPSMLFRVRLFQTEPVGGKRLACTYELCVEDFSGTPVSAPARVVADKASAEAAERELEATLSLTAGMRFESGATYYVVCREAETRREAWRREVRIEIAFAPVEDFGW